jgi:hypothetical protein
MMAGSAAAGPVLVYKTARPAISNERVNELIQEARAEIRAERELMARLNQQAGASRAA